MIVFLILAACGQRSTPVQWKTAYSAAECKALTERDAFLQRCYGGKDFADENYVGDLKCMPYSPPQHFTGVWVLDLEYSAFFPNATSYKEPQDRADWIWLRAEPPPSSDVIAAGQGAGTRAYAVDLIGRRSLCEFNYGHMGAAPQEVIAERIIAMRPLPVPRQ
ncbi:MAG TPA: hypothetical protein VF027_03485 [Sphingomicrobium sp.]